MPVRLDRSPTTSFGASTTSVEQAANVLRAQAAAHGAPLGSPTLVDLAAAVVTTELWCLVTGATRLSGPARYGQPACDVLSAAFCRATGTGADIDIDIELQPGRVRDSWFGPVEGCYAWAERELPGAGAVVLRRAAIDLAAGGPGEWAAIAALVADHAELCARGLD